MLSIRGLTTVYPGPVPALQGIVLDIPAGVFGLLEPNGPPGWFFEVTPPAVQLRGGASRSGKRYCGRRQMTHEDHLGQAPRDSTERPGASWFRRSPTV